MLDICMYVYVCECKREKNEGRRKDVDEETTRRKLFGASVLLLSAGPGRWKII